MDGKHLLWIHCGVWSGVSSCRSWEFKPELRLLRLWTRATPHRLFLWKFRSWEELRGVNMQKGGNPQGPVSEADDGSTVAWLADPGCIVCVFECVYRLTDTPQRTSSHTSPTPEYTQHTRAHAHTAVTNAPGPQAPRSPCVGVSGRIWCQRFHGSTLPVHHSVNTQTLKCWLIC